MEFYTAVCIRRGRPYEEAWFDRSLALIKQLLPRLGPFRFCQVYSNVQYTCSSPSVLMHAIKFAFLFRHNDARFSPTIGTTGRGHTNFGGGSGVLVPADISNRLQ